MSTFLAVLSFLALALVCLAAAGLCGCKNTEFAYTAPDGSKVEFSTAANQGLKATQNDYQSAAGIASALTGNSGGGRQSKFDETQAPGRIAFATPDGTTFEMAGATDHATRTSFIGDTITNVGRIIGATRTAVKGLFPTIRRASDNALAKDLGAQGVETARIGSETAVATEAAKTERLRIATP